MPDWKDLLARHGPGLVFGLMASATGGPAAHGAYLQGSQRRREYDAELARQQEQDAMRAEWQQAQLANIETDNQRIAQQQELAKLNALFERINQSATSLGETATDPAAAQAMLQRQAASIAQLYGANPEQVAGMVPNLAPMISGREKKRAADFISQLQSNKLYAGYFDSPEGLEQLKGVSAPWGEGQKTVGDILQMSGLPLETSAKKPGGGVNAGSFEEYVNAPPGRQATIEAARKRYMQADDRDAIGVRDTEPLVAIMGPDGAPVLVPRAQAVGKRPASTREQGRPVQSSDANRIAELDTSLNDLNTLEKEISVPGGTGAAAAIGAKVVPNVVTEYTGIGEAAKQRQAVIDRVKQVIGKALEGGVLRKEDEYKYVRILPTIKDPPPVAAAKIAGLRRALEQRRDVTLEALTDAGYDTSRFGAKGVPAAPAGPQADPLGLFK